MASFYGRTGIEFGGDLIENLQKLAMQVRPAATKAVEEAGELIRGLAYGNANVSPGTLGHGVGGAHMRDEIKVSTYQYDSGVSARIGVDKTIIPYAAHQEYGPHGNAFLRKAIDEGRQEAHQIIRSVFVAELGADGKVRTAVRIRNFA